MSKASKLNLAIRLFILAVYLFSMPKIHAQPSGGNFGLGIQFGEPSGLSLRIYQPGRMSAGTSCVLHIAFTPQLNEDILAEVGPE